MFPCESHLKHDPWLCVACHIIIGEAVNRSINMAPKAPSSSGRAVVVDGQNIAKNF